MEKFNPNNEKEPQKSVSDQKNKSKIQDKINAIETENENKLYKNIESFVKLAKKQAAAGVYPKEAIEKAMEHINDAIFNQRADLCFEIIAIQDKYNKDSSTIFDYLEKLPRMDTNNTTKSYLYGKVAKIKAEHKLDPTEQIERGLVAIKNIEIDEPSWGEKHALEMGDSYNREQANIYKIGRMNDYHLRRSYAYIGIAKAQQEASLDYSEVLKEAVNEAELIRQDKWNGKKNYNQLMNEIKKLDNNS